MKDMKTYRSLCMGLAMVAGMLFVSCEPLEDTSWVRNSLVTLDWSTSGNESGQRPAYLDSLQIDYFSHYDDTDNCSYIFATNYGEFDVQTGLFDVLVSHDTEFIRNRERIKTAKIVLPTELNEAAERVITSYPDSVLYAGFLYNVPMDYDNRLSIKVPMFRMTRKINFIVYVGDEQELMEPCSMDMSGMCYEMTMHNRKLNEEADGTQVFELVKYGRFYNEDHCLTAYKGTVTCLGTVGRNILYFTYVDCHGQTRHCTYDVTPYFKVWTTEETTVTLRILNYADEFDIIGWEVGGKQDIEIIY